MTTPGRTRRWIVRATLLLAVLVLVAAGAAWWAVRGSVPELAGQRSLGGLSSPVTISRDALGVVTIDAGSESDALRALGYVHAQERYFEMDLMRRTAAGELAELFGPRALDVDRRHRVHRMRARVTAGLDAIAGGHRPGLEAYVAGVNAGLGNLGVRPWPYLLLRQQPAPWLPADSALAGHAMYFDLQDSTNARELALWRMRPHLPPALYTLLTRDGTRWDAPLAGRPRGDAPLPTPAEVDLRALPMPAAGGGHGVARTTLAGQPEIGSNNFAVSGALTRDGRAIVADDMHLALRAPNIWFRARLRYPDARAPGGRVDVQGFTLPGLPAVIVGSNGHVAWGYTNSYADTADWFEVTPCTAEPRRVACTEATVHRETIAVAGAVPVALDVVESRHGPILHAEADGRVLALRWVAHLPGALDLGLMDFAWARGVEDALAIASRAAIPAQNLVVGDSRGRIAWQLFGPLPERRGTCSAATLVENARDAAAAHAPSATPVTPARGEDCRPWAVSSMRAPAPGEPVERLWTANNRALDGPPLALAGDAGYALGARARQIRDGLLRRQAFSERDLLAIQLDDRALFLAPWWRLLRESSAGPATPALAELADAAQRWEGRAIPGSTSYRVVRAWRLAVHARIADGLTAPAQVALGDRFEMPNLPQLEGVAWPLVTTRPPHLLPRRFASWVALFEDAAREVRDDLAARGPLHGRTWGERNTATICHPLAGAIPLLGKRWLCMPPDQLAGDTNMPRVAGPAVGASERMVVSPGHEADGIIHMPGGQSGHPLSPHWGAGHDDWVQGRPSPFLPGDPTHTLELLPARRRAN